ncbi:uncharacterized protein LAJ45_04974 [Morchella importuna]|uniref:uncharacterized protein n=1 Tax=Morchella importuna TaxID=1174673 RepID=UPI001E8D3772|nr:uncharacterized protein LAJ45_04974 [Morchella importuna]KAH8150793.1 hypothetical protein LAJ45_04974 [Morchella importuna]
MSKRRSDTQLTKDDYEQQGFSYQGNHDTENDRDAVDPTKMADSKIMSGRKIAPLKKGRGRGGAAGGSSRGGSSIPNFFAATPTGGFGTNGASQPEAGFSGFGTPQSAAPATPTFGGTATGGFNFGANSPAPEPPKVNPFASLAPSSTNGGFGTPQLGGLFGGSTPQSSSTGGMFGNNNNNNGNASPAPASTGFTFGNNAAPAQPATGFNKTPAFTFGSNSAAAPMFGGGDNKPATSTSASFTFGANNGAPAVVTPPATSSFNFGGSTATASGQPSGGYFGNNSFAPEKTPEPQATPAAAPAPTFTFGAATPQTGTPSTLFGKPADSQGKSLFAKPTEQQGSSLFGRPSHSPEPVSGNLFKPSPSPEPSNNLFGSPVPTPTTSSFFGQPKEQEQSKPSFGGFGDKVPATPKNDPPKALFGFGIESNTPQQEPPKSPFGGFGDNKAEPPKSPFFGGFGTPSEKKDEPSKPLFGFGPPTENKLETPKAQSPFFGAPSTPSVEINDDIMADNSPPKSPSVFNQPINSPSPFTGFGSPKLAAAPPKESIPPLLCLLLQTPSPPLPSDSTSWTTTQLNEYYNLFALRALNHSFLEGLKKADQMGDWSVSCEIYIKESKKIKECQQNGERYKGASVEPKLGSGVTAKRINTHDDEIQGGGGKRSKGNSEDSKFSGSDSSKALASVLGGGSSSTSGTDAYKLASKPTHGFVPPSASTPVTPSGVKLASTPLFSFKPPAPMSEKKDQEEKKNEDKPEGSPSAKDSSVLHSPNVSKNSGGFVNPFSSQVPGPLEKDEGDDDDDTPAAPSPSGSLFGRVSEPKKESTGSIFSNNNAGSGSGLFGSATSSSAPSPNASGNSSIFGTPGVKETGFSFGGTGPSTPIVPPSGPLTPKDDDDNNSEPNDNAHLSKGDIDLSKQGPGEEDEDSKFEVRAIVYEYTENQQEKPIKRGVGQLRVLKNRINGKARVLARTEVGKVVLNVGLVEGITYTPASGRGLKTVSVVEFLPDSGRKRYSVRVKEEADARKLGEAMDLAKMS